MICNWFEFNTLVLIISNYIFRVFSFCVRIQWNVWKRWFAQLHMGKIIFIFPSTISRGKKMYFGFSYCTGSWVDRNNQFHYISSCIDSRAASVCCCFYAKTAAALSFKSIVVAYKVVVSQLSRLVFCIVSHIRDTPLSLI